MNLNSSLNIVTKVFIKGPKNLFACKTNKTHIHIKNVHKAKKYVNLTSSEVIFYQYTVV